MTLLELSYIPYQSSVKPAAYVRLTALSVCFKCLVTTLPNSLASEIQYSVTILPASRKSVLSLMDLSTWYSCRLRSHYTTLCTSLLLLNTAIHALLFVLC